MLGLTTNDTLKTWESVRKKLNLLAFVRVEIVGMTFIAISAQAATPTMPTFYARRDYPGLFSNFVQVADTNGDGIPDLIASLSGYIEVLFGNGDDTFRSGPNTHSGADGAVGFVAVDLNGDGTIDLALANQNSIAVSMGNGDGTFQSSVLYPVNDSGLAP